MVTKKSAKKPATKSGVAAVKKRAAARAKKGKESVEKGAKFENIVADLYRLLGAKVVQNIEICQKKVDILATFPLPGSPTGHRVIIECKDEKRRITKNTRVMEFKGLLDLARKTGEADSAEIITRVPWSDQAKGFAREAGIVLLTYDDKVAQLVDLKHYLAKMVKQFDEGDPRRRTEPPLGKYFVELSVERYTKTGKVEIPDLDDYIKKWLDRTTEARHLAVLGEYGTGKTSWCQKLVRDYAESYLKNPGACRIPILFNLRDFTKTLKIESLVTSFLDEECGVLNPRHILFEAMNEAGIFLLVFDGFDEMAVRVDVDTLEQNLQEIEKLAAFPRSKVIITSRLEYFISGEEEKKALRPKGEILATRETEYESLKILQWEDEQVDAFLKKRVPLIKGKKKRWTFYRDQIKAVPGLSDLSRRPVLLDMIVKTLPQLIASGKPINRPNLYETYLLAEIKRQKIIKKRTLLLSDEVRFSLLQQLAADFYGVEIAAITFGDAIKYVKEEVNPPINELEAYTRDFLTCSFLVREGDQYRFSHRSIMEYLASRELNEEITGNRPKFFGRRPLDTVILEFLKELGPNQDILNAWIQSTRNGIAKDQKYLGGNAASIICAIDKTAFAGKNLSSTDLTGASLPGADLRDTKLEGALLDDVLLHDAWFFEKDLSSAEIEGIDIVLYVLLEEEDSPQEVLTPNGHIDSPSGSIYDHLSFHGISEATAFSMYGGGMILVFIEMYVPNNEKLAMFSEESFFPDSVIATFLYADQYDKFLHMIPGALVPDFMKLIR